MRQLIFRGAFRVTNEIYYSAAAVPISANGYAYDAAGNRIRLNKGGTVLTNNVSSGYRITQVKYAANGNVAESYGYDNGGRVTSITRDGAARNLGSNTADQLTGYTNSTVGSWVTY